MIFDSLIDFLLGESPQQVARRKREAALRERSRKLEVCRCAKCSTRTATYCGGDSWRCQGCGLLISGTEYYIYGRNITVGGTVSK